jgi:hypothetical protein
VSLPETPRIADGSPCNPACLNGHTHALPCESADLPRITTTEARPDEVFIHLPEFTYLDTQAWSAELGIPASALPALRDAIDQHLGATADAPATCGDRLTEWTCALPPGPHPDWRHEGDGHWWQQAGDAPYSNRDRVAAGEAGRG